MSVMSGVDVEAPVSPRDLRWLQEAIADSGLTLRGLSAALGLAPTQLSAELHQGSLSWDRVVALASALGVAIPVRRAVEVARAPAAPSGWRKDGARWRAAGKRWRAVAQRLPRGYQITWYGPALQPGALGSVVDWESGSLKAALLECVARGVE
jgi:hypothetical protein